MKEEKTIYHGQCEHLHCCDIESDECLKRFFNINDPNNNRSFRLVICNEYLRLLMYKKQSEDYSKSRHTRLVSSFNNRYEYKSLIESIVSEYVPGMTRMWGSGNRSSNDIMERTVTIEVCHRPRMYAEVKLIDLIKNMQEESFTSNYNSFLIKDSVLFSLKEYCEHLLQFKKYKYQEINMKRILSKIGKEYYHMNMASLFTDLFKEILLLTTIKNKNYETSKR